MVSPQKRFVPQTQATMTEQEAQVLAARLTRIWNVEVDTWNVDARNQHASFWIALSEEVEIQVSISKGTGFSPMVLSAYTSKTDETFLTYHSGYGLSNSNIGDYDTLPEHLSQHQSQWLTVFRRGCFLMGLPIEASAHEKMEGIQGFSREELEAWNLKM
ncbi:hypothetical protein IAD21_03730 [Abditibacteriota bacterium]|nr:hypothetical protein IAD21_03730 [Abditibacteriota bacterium]